MLLTNDVILDSANVLLDEARAINDCAQRLFSHEASREGYRTAIDLFLTSLEQGGKIVVTGVGKSGKIGEKIVATMLSLGTHAMFLHPVEAMHGDLGAVHAKDIVLALSYSGNTEELMRIVPSLEHRGVPIVGLGGNPHSQLAKCSAAWIDAQVGSEVSEIPAPTSSTTLALALGDAIAITLARQKKFTTHGFALNHPGGSLGRRLLLKVQDAMVATTQVATVLPTASLDLIIMEMTKHPKSGGVVVVEPLQQNHTRRDPSGMISPPSSVASEDGDASAMSSTTTNPDESTPSADVRATSLTKAEEEEEEQQQQHHQDDKEPAMKVIGVITHSNVHQVLKTGARETIFDIKARDIMTLDPVVCATNDLAVEALKRMTTHSTTGKDLPMLPVIDTTDKRTPWRGVVTLKDLQELF
ncbi:hypothetical protein O0I10_010900 [Lichtheimia ornata]|uniref:Uncharacterized protein n=1 Tax=Lichtheimia ornata TaxID=688661 RepID=A0AAD7XQX9_9FUNG|nr:uncharacterized protein O0I10_010900 [Lichtheimia ornata]KAJ8653464.1 hypothetical protein O0I10_010900 [Lichtheimia ornata]